MFDEDEKSGSGVKRRVLINVEMKECSAPAPSLFNAYK